MAHYKFFRSIAFTAVIMLLLLAVWSCTTLQSPARAYRKAVARQEVYDAVIVPGVPFDSVNWSNTMRARVLWSWLLYRNGRVKNIIYSGAAVYSPYYEAKIMGLYAQQLGIPATHIYYDTLAEHSTENVYYSYELARKLGFRSIALATEYDQAILLKRFVRRRFATRIKIFPVYEAMLDREVMPEPRINPAPAYKPGFIALPERESFGRRLGGTRGSKIPYRKTKGGRFAPL